MTMQIALRVQSVPLVQLTLLMQSNNLVQSALTVFSWLLLLQCIVHGFSNTFSGKNKKGQTNKQSGTIN